MTLPVIEITGNESFDYFWSLNMWLGIVSWFIGLACETAKKW